MQIENIAVDRLIPYARNSRTHSEAQVAQIAASIREFGFTNPVLIDANGGIIAGHGRVMGARQLGMAEVPCLRLGHLTETQKRAYIIADNKLALNAGWDEEMLALEFRDLLAEGYSAEMTGFSIPEIDQLIAGLDAMPEGKTDADETPEVQQTVVSQPGDVWILGKHRIMCGDSTRIDQAKTLMGGGMADMVFTDPPYNVAYEGRGDNDLGIIRNDNMTDAQFEQFLRDVFSTYWACMKALAPIYVCHPDSSTAPKLAFETTFAERFKKSSTIIWAKQSAGMGWQDYRAQHEPILYGWKDGKGKHYYCGDRAKTTLWQIGRDAQASYVHPTQKPVDLPAEAIKNSSKAGDVVLDLFGGSGSTLMACEQTGRVNRSMELDAKYCDVIVRRWQQFTGKRAVHAETKKEFGE